MVQQNDGDIEQRLFKQEIYCKDSKTHWADAFEKAEPSGSFTTIPSRREV